MKNNESPDISLKTVAIVAAGGIGSRFGGSMNKQFVTLCGKPVLVWSLTALAACPLIDEIIPVVHENELAATATLIEDYAISKVMKIVPGGKERHDSVMNGLIAACNETGIVVIHDGARPLISTDLVTQVILGLDGYDGSLAAVPVKDTIKSMLRGQETPEIDKTLDRSCLWSVQTPQVFRYATLHDSLVKAKKEHFTGTDDASFVEQYGGRIRIVSGSYLNIKITTQEDIQVAEAFLSSLLLDHSVKQVNV
jgi:2-C-methyl-D-erythritol 4-phosphate cytidylyltransferase